MTERWTWRDWLALPVALVLWAIWAVIFLIAHKVKGGKW